MLPDRKSVRLREFNYRQHGFYAVTLCVFERRCVFGRFENEVLRLHPFGKIAEADLLDVPFHYPNVILDEFVVMPNHVHAILCIEGEPPPNPDEECELRQFGKPQSGSLASIVGSYKSGVTNKIGRKRECRTTVWQRGFFEHVIRNEMDLQRQREYIQNNPANWVNDEFFRR